MKVLLIDAESDRSDNVISVLSNAEQQFKPETVQSMVDAEMRLKMSTPDLVLTPLDTLDGKISDLIQLSKPGQVIPVMLLVSPDQIQEAESCLSQTVLDYFLLTENTLPALPHAVDRAFTMWKLVNGRIARDTALWDALQQKDAFLKELYHRVKNNFQTICNMLSLQSQQVEDEKIQAIFIASQDRVRAMALIHERLQNSPDLMTVDFQEYATNLIKGLFWSYSADHRRISTDVQIRVNDLKMDTSIICGLIINELISNSLKYAFPPNYGVDCKISVRFTLDNFQQYVLEVEDNGVGIPDSVDFSNPATLGIQLVSIFARDQLNGTISIDKQSGTKIKIVFGRRE